MKSVGCVVLVLLLLLLLVAAASICCLPGCFLAAAAAAKAAKPAVRFCRACRRTVTYQTKAHPGQASQPQSPSLSPRPARAFLPDYKSEALMLGLGWDGSGVRAAAGIGPKKAQCLSWKDLRKKEDK